MVFSPLFQGTKYISLDPHHHPLPPQLPASLTEQDQTCSRQVAPSHNLQVVWQLALNKIDLALLAWQIANWYLYQSISRLPAPAPAAAGARLNLPNRARSILFNASCKLQVASKLQVGRQVAGSSWHASYLQLVEQGTMSSARDFFGTSSPDPVT